MVLLCGKFKVSGDGSAGQVSRSFRCLPRRALPLQAVDHTLQQPWMTPRYVPDIMGYKWSLISGGGVTIFCHAKDPKEGDFTVCWGQTATYGELALGEGAVSLFVIAECFKLLDRID